MSETQRTALITGGAGFLGSHLADKLLGLGRRVIVMDNLCTGNLDNIAHLRDRDDFRFVEHDITEHIDLDESPDMIYHLASPASPIDYLEMPIQTLKVGALGTHNVLGLARKCNARVLLASTSEVYGDPLVHPQPETYWGNVNPIGPRGVYDEAKRFAESITMAYHNSHGLETRIVRIFNTYGPRMRPNDGRVVPAFCVQALKGLPMTVFGDGSQTRSFCFCTDLLEGIFRLSESDFYNPCNIGNPAEMSVLAFAEKIRELSNSSSEIVFKELPEDDPKIRQPDISRAKELLDWKPQTQLEDGLNQTLAYFNGLLEKGII